MKKQNRDSLTPTHYLAGKTHKWTDYSTVTPYVHLMVKSSMRCYAGVLGLRVGVRKEFRGK